MPGTDALHSALTGTNIHVPYAWSYADETAREGASGFAAGDVGKLALQEDDNSLWLLTATTPTWVAVGGSGGSGDVTWAIIQASQLQNEVMNFPSYGGIDEDLDALNMWWDKVGTPSTAVTMVDLAGEGGITETWEYALKTVCDGAGEGFLQRYTYADQPRVKSGRALSAIAAVWVGTAGTTVTMKLVTSAATEVSATATAQGWTVLKAENLTLDGTYVDLQFTTDTADTFYVVPLGVNIGAKAVPLSPRGERCVEAVATVVNNADPADTNWVAVDLTAVSSPLCFSAQLYMRNLSSTTSNRYVDVRRKGTELTKTASSGINQEWRQTTTQRVWLDDGQEYQYRAQYTEVQGVYHFMFSYWEWL